MAAAVGQGFFGGFLRLAGEAVLLGTFGKLLFQQVLPPLSEGQRDMGMCAVARLLNRDGQMQVERLNRYFASHSDMDRAYGWGFQWRAGSK